MQMVVELGFKFGILLLTQSPQSRWNVILGKHGEKTLSRHRGLHLPGCRSSKRGGGETGQEGEEGLGKEKISLPLSFLLYLLFAGFALSPSLVHLSFPSFLT